MPNQTISTLTCCIGSIQLKLYDFGMEKLNVEKILAERFKQQKTPRNVNNKLILLADNHFESINPICPKCGSKTVIKQEYRVRNPILGEYGQQRIYLRRYQCKKCSKKFTTPLDSIVKPYHRYAHVFKDKTEQLIKTGYRSLRKIKEDFNTFFNHKPSHQTIKNWLTIKSEYRINNDITAYSGYYSYDEQYIRINGRRMYRLTLYDTIVNIPVAEEIVPKRSTEAITNFIQISTKNKPLISITTDHFPRYKNIMDKIKVNHQLCIFHLFKMIGDPVYKILRSKKYSNQNKMSLCLYFTDIKNIFRAYDEETVTKRLENLLSKFKDIPRLLQKFIAKKNNT